MTLFPSLTGSIRGKICWQWSAKGSGGSSLPAWAGVAFHPATWSLCPPQGRRPSSLVSPAWLLAEVQRWLQKALAFFQFSPSPRDTQSSTHATAGLACRDFRGEQRAACTELHPSLKKICRIERRAKSITLVGVVLGVAIPFSQNNAVRWELLWQLFVNLFMLLKFPSFSTVW